MVRGGILFRWWESQRLIPRQHRSFIRRTGVAVRDGAGARRTEAAAYRPDRRGRIILLTNACLVTPPDGNLRALVVSKH